MASTSSPTESPPLGKYLASADKKTRDKATKNLAVFLSDSSRNALPKSEMDKLWKGIFYCFWMSDKPLVQQALASELAGLLLTITPTSSSLAFLRGFWETTVREWNGIDRLRIDKYYMLVRRFVNASLRLLQREDWDSDACREYNAILTLQGGPLCPDDNRVPVSLAYHLADIYLEELDKAVGSQQDTENEDESRPAPLGTLLDPFFALAARTQSKHTYERLQSALLEPVVQSLAPAPARSDESPSVKRRRLADAEFEHFPDNACMSDPKEEGKVDRSTLRKALLRKLFDIASDQGSRDSNRRKLYAFWRAHVEDDEDETTTSVDAKGEPKLL